MKKILTLLLLITFTISLVPPKKSHAAAPLVARVVGGSVGERIVVGMAERSGVKFASKKAREKAVERWNLELYEKVQYYNKVGKQWEAEELARFQKSLVEAKPADVVEIPTRPGFGQIAVGAFAFLTGADIILEMKDSYLEAVGTGKMLETMKGLEEDIESGDVVLSYGGITAFQNPDDINMWMLGIPGSNTATSITGTRDPNKPSPFAIEKVEPYNDENVWVTFRYAYWHYQGYFVEERTSRELINKTLNGDTSEVEDFKRVGSVPSQPLAPNHEPLTWTRPLEEADNRTPPEIEDYPWQMPSAIPIEIPMLPTAPEMDQPDPWNPPLGEPGTPTEPVPPPSGEKPPVTDPLGDPISPPLPGTEAPTPKPPGGSGDGDPTGNTPKLPNFVPLALLFALFDLLRAILEYVARMFTFVATIPLIPEKPIDNTAFQWFRNVKIMGVYIYSTVSMMATLGLSFMVYKSVRRLLP